MSMLSRIRRLFRRKKSPPITWKLVREDVAKIEGFSWGIRIIFKRPPDN